MAAKKDKGKSPTPKPRSAQGDWLTENIEAIVIAIIMALVIRQFCIEAFKIPTSSMEPTLIGREVGGDRILVNKFSYRLEKPKRWDVVVFKYPLNRSKNFIKRLVGLPNEIIRLQAGDIYRCDEDGTFRILRKPPRVQKGIWQEVFPIEDKEWSNGIGRPAQGEWRAVSNASFEFDASCEGSERVLKPAKDGGDGWLYYTGSVYAHGEKVEMGDVRVSFEARPGPSTRFLAAVVSFGAETFDFRLAVGAGTSEILRDGKSVAHSETAVEPDSWIEVAFEHVDGTARLLVDGDEVVSFPYEPDLSREITSLRAIMKVGSLGGSSIMRDLHIHRDIYYFTDPGGIFRETGSVKIGPAQYFMLGDNTVSSKDSRLWTKVRFERNDGTIIEGDGDSTLSPDDPEKYYRNDDAEEVFLTDMDGRRHKLRRDEVKNFYPRKTFAPFVPEENIIGQAFLVFWPLKRLELIR